MSILSRILNPQEVSAVMVKNILIKNNITWEQMDNRYFTVKYKKWNIILVLFKWISWKRYRPEVYDCDDFAHTFRSFISTFAGINTVGVVIGTFYDIDEEYRHAWNIIITEEGDYYMLEPQTMKFVGENYVPDQVLL